MLFEGYFKDVYENGIEEEQITERVKLMVDDVDTIVMALANNLKGYKGYRKIGEKTSVFGYFLNTILVKKFN